MTDAEGEKLAGVSEGATKTAASSTNGNVNIDGKEASCTPSRRMFCTTRTWRTSPQRRSPLCWLTKT